MPADYLESRWQFFQTTECPCHTQVALGSHTAELIAIRPRIPGDWVFVFTRFDTLDVAGMQRYLADAEVWAAAQCPKPTGLARWLYPGLYTFTVYAVAIVQNPDEPLLDYARDPWGYGKQAARAIPVVYDEAHGQFHYVLKVSVFAPVAWQNARQVIRKQLWPARPTPQPPVSRPTPHPLPPAPARGGVAPPHLKRPAIKARTATTLVPINADRAGRFLERAFGRQRFGLAIAAAAPAALIGGVFWGIINGSVGFPVEWIPFLGLGSLVGFMVRVVGHGFRRRFGIVGGVAALAGCLICRILSLGLTATYQMGNDFVLLPTAFDLAGWVRLAWDAFHWTGVVALVLTVVQGYRTSFQRVTRQEMSFLADGGEPP